jgi:hypothetical protein
LRKLYVIKTFLTKLEPQEQRIREKDKSSRIPRGHRTERQRRRNCPSDNGTCNKDGGQPTEGNVRPMREKRFKHKSRKGSKGNVGASSLCEEAGVYTGAKVNEFNAKFLIDTSAPS